MFPIQDRLTDWAQRKVAQKNWYHLISPMKVEKRWTRGQPGHPSNHAYVEFVCEPSDDFQITFGVTWPTSASKEYWSKLEEAISDGIVEALSCHLYPHFGVKVTLTRYEWDEVESSLTSFYSASKLAMDIILKTGSWKIKQR